jgi:nitroreductase
MNVIEALNSRTSIRAFKPDPVSRETILKILQAATRSPSWANTQPWEIYVAAGEALNRLRQGFQDRQRKGLPRNLDLPAPQKWPDALQKRMAALMADRSKIPVVTPPGQDLRQAMMERNYRFFDAPVVVYLCMDRALTPWSVFDIGLLSQSIMLTAQEYKVDSIPAVMLVAYPDLIRAELDIPPDLLVLFGIALGYRDAQEPLNQLRTARRPLDEVVRIKGL